MLSLNFDILVLIIKILIQMSTFKSPELHICGRIKTVQDIAEP